MKDFVSTTLQLSIPRPRGRGLIEAVPPCPEGAGLPQFHDRAVVASLKRGRRVGRR